jgi:hypothetical protein
MPQFIIVAHNLELPQGTRFTYKARHPIEAGSLCLLTIGKMLTIGRYYPDLAGFDCIVQPGLLRVVSRVAVEVWGLVAPISNVDHTRSILLVGGAIVQACHLVVPFAA